MGTAVKEAILRRLSTSDVEDILLMESAHQFRPWSEQIIRDELEGDGRIYMAVLSGAALFGFGGVMVVGEEAHITNLLIAPDQRRKGYARQILVALIGAALGQGARHLTLEVRSRNQAAIDLYRRFGLAPVGFRMDYYGDDHALIMWAYDIDSVDYRNKLQEMT